MLDRVYECYYVCPCGNEFEIQTSEKRRPAKCDECGSALLPDDYIEISDGDADGYQ